MGWVGLVVCYFCKLLIHRLILFNLYVLYVHHILREYHPKLLVPQSRAANIKWKGGCVVRYAVCTSQSRAANIQKPSNACRTALMRHLASGENPSPQRRTAAALYFIVLLQLTMTNFSISCIYHSFQCV